MGDIYCDFVDYLWMMWLFVGELLIDVVYWFGYLLIVVGVVGGVGVFVVFGIGYYVEGMIFGVVVIVVIVVGLVWLVFEYWWICKIVDCWYIEYFEVWWQWLVGQIFQCGWKFWYCGVLLVVVNGYYGYIMMNFDYVVLDFYYQQV